MALGVVGTAFGGAAVAVGDGARGWRAPGGAFGPPVGRMVGSDGGRGHAWRARPTPPGAGLVGGARAGRARPGPGPPRTRAPASGRVHGHPRPGPPAASAMATSSDPARCRTPKRPTVHSPATRARSGRGRPPPSSPPSSTACPISLPIPVAAAAGPPRIVGIPTEWGRHLWGRRDPRDAPGGKVCDNFPHFAPPRIFLGNTRVSKVKYGDTPVTSP